MSRQLLIIASMLLFSICASPAQTPSPDAMTAARGLVTTMKLSDQYKALLPAILLNLKPALVQDRPEIERDYDAMTAMIADTYTPFYNEMLEGAATVVRAQQLRTYGVPVPSAAFDCRPRKLRVQPA